MTLNGSYILFIIAGFALLVLIDHYRSRAIYAENDAERLRNRIDKLNGEIVRYRRQDAAAEAIVGPAPANVFEFPGYSVKVPDHVPLPDVDGYPLGDPKGIALREEM